MADPTDEPAGVVLVAGLGLGLLCFSIWRFAQAIFDADGRGSDAEGIAARSGMIGSGLAHAALAVLAVQTLVSGASSGGPSWPAWLLRQEFGPWFLGGIGVGIAVGGVFQLRKAWKGDFQDHLTVAHSGLIGVSRFGLAARGIVFGIVGASLVAAGFQYEPSRVKGVAAALDTIRAQPYGAWLFAATAFGLLAFAVYCLVEAAYRRVETN